MSRVVRLAERRTSKETIETLKALLAEARAGEIVGLAYIALQQGAEYTADVTGSCKTSRVITVGAIQFLVHRLLQDP